MSDLTKRLRGFGALSWFLHDIDKYEVTLTDANAIVSAGHDAADEIDRLRAALAEARRERDLLAYHVAPHTDEEFRASHCAEQIIDAGLQRALLDKIGGKGE